MDGVIGCANCVTVTGAATDQTYNGDGHVVGPGNGSKSLTLGTTDGATASNSNSTLNASYDTFISNTANKDGTNQISTQIIITFTHGFTLNGNISFDYEIFPDATGTTQNPPDLTFNAWDGVNLLKTKTFLGVTPGTSPVGATHSPASGANGTESSPQLIGTYSTGPLSNITELDFIDWPATIGVDNLKSTVPEPRGTSLLLGGLMLAAFAGTKLRRVFAKS